MRVPHRPPRRPWAWIPALLLSQLLVFVLWMELGWGVGLALMLLSHGLFLWGVFAPNAALYGPVLSRLETPRREVWLTIDDGPSDDTPALLDLLDRHDAKATFFLVGARAQARPELVREILRRGHGIGNHSQTHPQARFWALGPWRMRDEIGQCQQVLAEIGGDPPRWFRAVVGHANPFVSAPLQRHGLARVGWRARGFDAVASDPEQVTARIARDLAPGAIVLLHEGAAHGRSVEIVARVLARLQREGYRAVLPDGEALDR